MTRPLAVVDYGVGNLRSAQKAFETLGQPAEITSDAERIAAAPAVVLPGQGAFGTCMENLAAAGLVEPVRQAARSGRPFLGICVGMQWMLASSEEAPDVLGLGLWPGECSRFPAAVKSPHVGWNSLEISARSSRLLRGVPAGSFVYFTHSYRVPLVAATVAACDYGGGFSAAVEQDNIFGVQFHPEKSGPAGLKILENFRDL